MRATLIIFLALASLGFCDIGKPISHFSSTYGKSLGQKSTSSGQISAWNFSDSAVIMAEFGSDGRARSVVYRFKSGVDESVLRAVLSKNSVGSGSFYRVDMPKLNSLLASLPKALNDPNAPSAAKAFASKMTPAALGALQQTLAGVGDLRVTRDGKYIAIVDARGQVLILEINGPALPLLDS